MTKRYLLDILFGALVITVVLLITPTKSTVDLNIRSLPTGKEPPSDISKREMEKTGKGIVREIATIGVLKERNLFGLFGHDPVTGKTLKTPLSKNPYTLIGILQGEEKKAVFREPSGAIVALTSGKKLVDGSEITRIDDFSVRVKKGDEEREIRIFNIKTPSPFIRKKP